MRNAPSLSLAALAAGDGRQDRNGVGLADLGVELVEVAHVVVVHVHVDELVQLAVFGDDLVLETGKAAHEVGEDLAQRGAVGVDDGLPARVRTKNRWDADLYRHEGRHYLRTTTGSSVMFPSMMR